MLDFNKCRSYSQIKVPRFLWFTVYLQVFLKKYFGSFGCSVMCIVVIDVIG